MRFKCFFRDILGLGSLALVTSKRFYLRLGLLLVVLSPYFPLSADRIYLSKGNVLRGTILSIGTNAYKFQDTNGKVKNVPKHKIRQVIFAQGRSERGYDKFFARINAGLGGAQNSLSLSNAQQEKEEIELASGHLLLRVAMDAGWQVLYYQLALHGGLEYSYSDLLKNKDASYNYLTLNLGASYFLPIPRKWPRLLHNTHIGLQARLLLNGSARFSFPDAAEEVNSAMQADGIGFGLSLGKEWYTSDWKIWGLSLSYTLDSFQIPEQEVTGEGGRGLVSIPGTPSTSLAIENIKGPSKMSTIGLNFSLAWD